MLRIHAVSTPTNPTTIIDGAIAQLIEGVGDERFPARLFKASHDSIGCMHLGAFAFDQHNRPALIFAENTGPSAVARQTGERYVKHYWKMDPIRKCRLVGLPGPHMIEITADDIGYADYRHDCYTAPNLRARISISEVRTYGMIRLNFYSEVDFRPAETSAIANSVNLLMPLLWRHGRKYFEPLQRWQESNFAALLGQLEPSLSERELQVCALMAAGLTSEGIALKLGISLNTVLTYRKRAYFRLQISSQNDLLRLLLQ
jgi:LuxR family transcriptional regulator, activator of tox operons